MPFREKSAWISLLTMLLVFGHYFAGAFLGGFNKHSMAAIHYLLMSIIAVVLLQVVLHVVAALLSKGDAGSPKDERERLIELKATSVGYWVLVAACLSAPLSLHLGGEFGDLPYMVLGAIVVSDVVKSAVKIVRYRLGS